MRKDMECYMTEICRKITYPAKCINSKTKKIATDEMIVPGFNNIDDMCKHNYNREQLKMIMRYYKLKQSGNKNELFSRAYTHLFLSRHAVKIQALVRGGLYRVYTKYRGPAITDRSMCVNNEDFLTMDSLNDIPYVQFFSYKDADGFVYGFNIVSLYNLIGKTHRMKQYENPYNRKPIPKSVIRSLNRVIRLSIIFGDDVSIEIDECEEDNPSVVSLQTRITRVFHLIDQRGHYTNSEWFQQFSALQIRRFMRELIDIWNYRAGLSSSTRREICPPHGDPFRGLQYSQFFLNDNLEEHRIFAVEVMEKLVNLHTDTGKDLGAFYILGAMTLASQEVADAIPWLYQSFAYNLV
jgi:hypothetical protein